MTKLTKAKKYQALLGYVGDSEQQLSAFLYVRSSHDEQPLTNDEADEQAHELVQFLDEQMQQAQLED